MRCENHALKDKEATILSFVKGHSSLEALMESGISIKFQQQPDGLHVDFSGGEDMHISPTISDIVSGLLTNDNHQNNLQQWATILLTADFITLTDIENEADYDLVLEALWESSFTGKLSPTTKKQVESLKLQELLS